MSHLVQIPTSQTRYVNNHFWLMSLKHLLMHAAHCSRLAVDLV